MTCTRWREVNSAPVATLGFVKRVNQGWPTNALPLRQVVHRATRSERKLFKAGMTKAFEGEDDIFDSGVYDFDKAIFLYVVNDALKKSHHNQPQLSMDQLDGCIAYYDVRGRKLW